MKRCYLITVTIACFLLHFSVIKAQQSNLSCSMTNVFFINSSTPSFTVTGTPSASGLSFWSNAGRVVDGSTSNFATGTIAITGGLTYRVSDASNTYAAGNYVGFVIKSGLLSLSALGSITISTYNGSSLQETFSSSSLIAVNSAITGAYDIGFYTNKPFTSIQLNISNALGLSSYDVYYAFIRGTGSCTSPALICNNYSNIYFPRFASVIDPTKTGTSGISLTALTNEDRVVDNDTNNFASITTLASAVGQVFLAVKDVTTDYPAGTFAGFDMENNTLLSTGVFNNVSIKTYRDNVLMQSFSGSNLLLGANLFSGSARQRVGFVVDSSFDEVQLVINQPLAVSLGTTKVYNAVFKKFCAGAPLACNTPTNIADSLQPVYINGAATNITGAFCGSCAITQTGNVIDGSDATHANINLSAGVLVTASLSVKNAIATYPAGTFAGFDIKSSSLLDLSLLNNFAIKTYRNDTLQENISGNSLFVGASSSLIGGNSRMVLGIAATKAFDEMRLVVNQPVSVSLGTIEVYNAILTNFCDNPLGCRTTNVLNNPDFPVYIDQQKSGLSGLACLGCSVDNANRVITADSSDFATITMVAGGGSTGSIAVKTAGSVFPAKSFAGFTLREMNGLLKLNFLKSIQITTYKGGAFRESRTAGSLLDLTLLFPILGGSQGKTVLGFATTKDYDEVQISVTSLIGVAPIVRVYNAFIGTHNVDSITSSILCPKSPNAEPDHLSVNENSPLHSTVSTNDKDPNSSVLKYNPTLPVGTTHGTVVMDTNGNFSYTPDSNFIGVDSFKYSVCNAASLCTTEWAYVSVVPNPGTTNHAPIAQTDNGQTLTNSPLKGNLSSNDVDPDGDSLSYTNVSNVKHGTLTVNTDGSYTYVPDSSFVGTDTAINQVCDNGTPSICVNSLLIIQVNPMLDSPSANHPPYAQDDVASTQANHPLTGNVLNNDSDPDGDSLNTTFLDTVPPAIGTFTPSATGGYTFVPAPNYTGTVAVRYAACDGGTPAKCDTATLSITVTAEKPKAPIAEPDHLSVNENHPISSTVRTNDLDPNTGVLNYDTTLATGPSHGSVGMNTNGTFTYTPDSNFNGVDSFKYTVCNAVPLCTTAWAYVSVVPNPGTTNHAPIAQT
ncbi:MAG: tandem-95 repeat protein, partial [Bacteroidetes bacterium]|nr:tandem-95 repeat protein [Bacteroidota bacterium]